MGLRRFAELVGIKPSNSSDMENGRRQELNLIERIKAYGMTVQADAAESFRLVLAAEKKREIHVYRQGGGVRQPRRRVRRGHRVRSAGVQPALVLIQI